MVCCGPHSNRTASGPWVGGAPARAERREDDGTHFECPFTVHRGRQTLDKVPIEGLVGAAVRIDVTDQSGRDRDYRVTIQDFEQWEAAHGRIPNRAIVLVDTGFA